MQCNHGNQAQTKTITKAEISPMEKNSENANQIKLSYRNNNAEPYKLFHISVTCKRKEEKGDTYLREIQCSICDRKPIKDIIYPVNMITKI